MGAGPVRVCRRGSRAKHPVDATVLADQGQPYASWSEEQSPPARGHANDYSTGPQTMLPPGRQPPSIPQPTRPKPLRNQKPKCRAMATAATTATPSSTSLNTGLDSETSGRRDELSMPLSCDGMVFTGPSCDGMVELLSMNKSPCSGSPGLSIHQHSTGVRPYTPRLLLADDNCLPRKRQRPAPLRVHWPDTRLTNSRP